MRRLTLSVLLLGALVSIPAQTVSVGAKGGVIATDPTRIPLDQSRWYTVGPSVEVRLPAGFAVEASALYQRIGFTFSYTSPTSYTTPPTTPPTTIVQRQRGNSWEFPLLGKYYFRRKTGPWQPFVSTGYSFRKIWWTYNYTAITSGAPVPTPSFRSTSSLGVGAVFGGGVRFAAGRFKIAPEFRYTRWGGADVTAPNQAGILLGIHF